MSSGNFSNRVTTISEEDVKNICPKEFEALEKALGAREEYPQNLDDLADEANDNGQSEVPEYNTLLNAFKEKTGVDISIHIHNAEELYDDIDGRFWNVESEVYGYNELGKKLNELCPSLQDQYFVTYG